MRALRGAIAALLLVLAPCAGLAQPSFPVASGGPSSASVNGGTLALPLSVANGGTGASSTGGARVNLGLSAVATSGSYADLLNLPALSAVALSGSYADLLSKPTIPAASGIATSTMPGLVKGSSTVAVAADGTMSAVATSSTTPYTLPSATASSLGGIKAGAGLTVAGDGTLSATAAPTAFQRSSYSASGTIAPSNTLAVLTGSAALSMTLLDGTFDGQSVLIVTMGSVDSTVTCNCDGTSQPITLRASAPGTVRDKIRPRWSAVDSTWFVE